MPSHCMTFAHDTCKCKEASDDETLPFPPPPPPSATQLRYGVILQADRAGSLANVEQNGTSLDPSLQP